jgi:hypothetical protein
MKLILVSFLDAKQVSFLGTKVISVRLIPEKPSKGLLWINCCCTFAQF